MVPVAFQRCSVKASVSLLLLVLVAGGGGWMLLGQGIAEMRWKVVNGTFQSPATTSVTSASPSGFARVSLITDEWLAVPLKGGEDKSPKNDPTGETPTRGKCKTPEIQLLNANVLSSVVLFTASIASAVLLKKTLFPTTLSEFPQDCWRFCKWSKSCQVR